MNTIEIGVKDRQTDMLTQDYSSGKKAQKQYKHDHNVESYITM